MENYEKIMDKIYRNEIVFLKNEFEEWVVKFNNGIWYGKFKGGMIYPINETAKLCHDTVLDAVEITEEEYLAY